MLVLVIQGRARVKSDAPIAHLNVNTVIGAESEADIDAIDMGVLHRVEQELADALKEQDANIAGLRVRSGVSGHTHDDVVLLLRSFCQPYQSGRQATNV